ncbi:hypothetical protein NEOLEDRAFT_1143587 [Neolentinus lepideus HHB14362 ss-1]|uniref:Uncharacterized protein n=1 Tax=Neolentinus lepideus HHB14362 ss-1 TaxID=1314782 RepID=A0A165MFR7_9AGAM|nr:hypothetical protein NEOLEDRAFT_1143587 [Neolentinus lepideus HHB14362 ss-1]
MSGIAAMEKGSGRTTMTRASNPSNTDGHIRIPQQALLLFLPNQSTVLPDARSVLGKKATPLNPAKSGTPESRLKFQSYSSTNNCDELTCHG